MQRAQLYAFKKIETVAGILINSDPIPGVYTLSTVPKGLGDVHITLPFSLFLKMSSFENIFFAILASMHARLLSKKFHQNCMPPMGTTRSPIDHGNPV